MRLSPGFSPRWNGFGGLPEGRGFSPAEIAAPALCSSKAPRSLRPQAARGPGHGNSQEGLRTAGLNRLRKNPSQCHPEEAKPVLSETKEGPLYLLENSNTGVLRFAQDDSIGAFFRSL